WPADWWQRDYDTMEGPPTAEDPAAGGYLTEADGDARYSQLGHTHAHVFNAEWSLSTNTTAGDPGAGKVRESTLDLQAAGDLYLSTLDAADTDWSLYLQALAAGDTVVLQDRDDSTRKAAYQLAAAAVDEGGWYRLPVTPTPTPSTLAPTNNQALLVSFASPGHP
ncbi:MAG TPA: hypothetical protein VKB54_07120, partial [Solirubrobacteraceae bacterium]|nr:hypothetical protein [Solirubrobacteraceae bacterium]